jgi:predicted permease
MIVFIVVWLGVVYLRNRSADASTRRFPVAETATAVIAFSTSGLVTPESPLNAKLDGDDQVVWTLIITTVGAGLLALMGLWLNDKVRR